MDDHIFEIEQYENLLPKIHLTSEEIECQVAEYNLEFLPDHNNDVEWKMELPMFVTPFYDFVVNCDMIPTQKESYDHYLSSNGEFFIEHDFDSNMVRGIKARYYRAYPSLVRDVYFNKYVSEHLLDYTVLYNTTLDIEEGIDLLIADGDDYWGICMFTETKRAYQGRKAKEKRHTPFSNVRYIELPVEFRGSMRIGDFFFYGKKEFDRMASMLKADCRLSINDCISTTLDNQISDINSSKMIM